MFCLIIDACFYVLLGIYSRSFEYYVVSVVVETML